MLHPYIRLACRAMDRKGPDTRTVEQRRADDQRGLDARPVPDDGLEVADHRVPVRDGVITVRSYRRPGEERLPVHVYLHGGSYWFGSIDTVDPYARRYALRADCVVVNVDYRLAPEHTFPTAAEDGYAALEWTLRHADDLRVDPDRVSVGGVSVGGGMAAVMALMARDRGGPRIGFQLLEVPALDMTLSQPSIAQFATGRMLTRADLVIGVDRYCPDAGQRRLPYASPLLAPDLSGLPPAFVLTAEFDPLRDEGEAYARRLQLAGTDVQLVRARGHIHSSVWSDQLRSSREYQWRTAYALAGAYAMLAAERGDSSLR